MTLTIPDDIAKLVGLTDRDLLIELACRLYDAERLDLFHAARLAGLDRVGFESALWHRGISVYRPTVEDLEHDFTALSGLGI
jgi:predicted HTH domain antitoxin